MTCVRGEVWWATIPGLGEKPVVIVSRNLLNRTLGEVTIARVTAVERERSLPTHVRLEPDEIDGLGEQSFVICHNLHTLPLTDLRTRLDTLSPARMVDIEEALTYALDLPTPTTT